MSKKISYRILNIFCGKFNKYYKQNATKAQLQKYFEIKSKMHNLKEELKQKKSELNKKSFAYKEYLKMIEFYKKSNIFVENSKEINQTFTRLQDARIYKQNQKNSNVKNTGLER